MPQFFLAASAERDSIAIVKDGRMFLEIVDVCQVQQDACIFMIRGARDGRHGE